MDLQVIPKPPELLALHFVTAELFDLLQLWFEVPDLVTLDLADVDAGEDTMADPTMIAALAMRKLQALRLLARPGVRTTTDVVVTIVQDLTRALLQAQGMRLQIAAEKTNWDEELVNLDASSPAPESVEAADPEAGRFDALHGQLHEAVQAVLLSSDGEICFLE